MSQPLTSRQRRTAHSLIAEWADQHRAVTLQLEAQRLDALGLRFPHPERVTHFTALRDRIGGEYASRIIGRTVTSLHDLTAAEASQVIGSLMNWLREQKRRR